MTVALLQNRQLALGRERVTCAAPVQESQGTPGSVEKCGQGSSTVTSCAAPDVQPAKSPFWSWAAGPGRI